MIEYLDQLIGTTYEAAPMPYVLCVMILIWFIYQFWTFMYWLLGGKK